MAEIIICTACGVKNRVRAGIVGQPLCGKCKQPLPPVAKVRLRDLTTDNFESSMRLNPQPMLVDFWAKWCMPCRTLAPVLERFAAAHDEITVARVDTEAEPGLASQFQIFGVPTLIMFVKGLEAHRVSGAMSLEELEAAFRPWLKKK